MIATEQKPRDYRTGSCLTGLLHNDKRRTVVQNDLFADHDFLHVLLRGKCVHQIEHQLFHDHPESARADLAFHRFLRDCLEGGDDL